MAVADADSGAKVSATTTVSHKAVGIKPYSLAMGALKVADEVGIEFHATVGASE